MNAFPQIILLAAAKARKVMSDDIIFNLSCRQTFMTLICPILFAVLPSSFRFMKKERIISPGSTFFYVL